MNSVVALIVAAVPDPDKVTPGPVGFLTFFFVAVAVILLAFDLVRRIRRTTYRAEIQERLKEEAAAQARDAKNNPSP